MGKIKVWHLKNIHSFFYGDSIIAVARPREVKEHNHKQHTIKSIKILLIKIDFL